MNILLHGRFQPPHKGHLALIKYILKKYKKSRLIISLDVREKDVLNPFSFSFRKRIFQEELKFFQKRIIITKHRCHRLTYKGCLLPTYENAKKFGKIDLVIGGPDLPEEVKNLWHRKGIKVETVKKRFFDLSATELRLLLKKKNLGFSIITNFGCRNHCWYCIWRNFHLLKNKLTSVESTDWKKLEELIKWYPGKKINVSGGLEPLFNYQQNKKWWNRLFKIAKKHKKLIDVHTRELLFKKDLLANVNKLVISFDGLSEFRQIKNQLIKYAARRVKIRLVKVITAKTKLNELEEIIDFSNRYHFQITFKQLYGFNDQGNFNKLRKKLNKIYDFEKYKIRFLKQGDYNVYFMPDNKLYETFILLHL